jgi:hypothetical protein
MATDDKGRSEGVQGKTNRQKAVVGGFAIGIGVLVAIGNATDSLSAGIAIGIATGIGAGISIAWAKKG